MNNFQKSLAVIGAGIVFSTFFLLGEINKVNAQFGSCSEYGVMAYESGGYCKCMSGYVMGDDFMGNSQCVSGDSVCHDKYGYGSDYDSLSGSCECSYGYVWGESMFGERQCITESQACTDQLGLHSRSTYGGNCECSYGYVIDGGQCKDGDQVCKSDHGWNASYDSLSNKCECDDDYTFDDTYQCVEKQHNVYFKVLDIKDGGKTILVKSEYDSRKYIIDYGVGCLDFTIEGYLNKNLVINLGTDYEVDTWDTIVLQDNSQTCSIVRKERTYEDTFPEEEEEEEFFNYYVPPAVSQTPIIQAQPEPVIKTSSTKEETPSVTVEDAVKEEITESPTSSPTTTVSDVITGSVDDSSETTAPPVPKESIFKRIINFFKNLF